ncbi:Conserved hypothetical membrane protein [Candidatus Protochlamydia naegleriophila]|uniref:histidine kinase n=1 Tax=Candidatus Protochlamydia naegleriophila TaxID=389348 RepID=A0A0U5EQL0_9BACT|nr:ATP-binding protein [Candidatus Protochlamydia naegleriophila]CUI16353.1 Conserved hypothetical membrane protein [Candidatus Protochlamydia naegleriophila]
MTFNPFKFPWSRYLAHSQHYGLPLAIFIICLLLTGAAFRFYQTQDYNRTHAEFDRLADIDLVVIQEVIQGTVEQFNFITQLFYASENVTKEEFRTFTLNSIDLYPNLIAIGWKPLSDDSKISFDQKQYIQFISPDAQDPKTSQFVSLDYLELSTAEPLYIDRNAYASFQHLLSLAATSTKLIVSDEVTFYREGERTGFFLLSPIFWESPDLKSEQASLPLKGIIIGFSDFEKILQEVVSRIPIDLNFEIYKKLPESNKRLFSRYPSQSSPHPKGDSSTYWSRNLSFNVGDQVWTVRAFPNANSPLITNPWSHLEVLIIGTLLSALTALYFLVLGNRHLLVEQEVHKRTEELAETNRILEQEIHERQRIEEEYLQAQHYLQRRHEALEYLTKFTTSELKSSIQEVILKTASVMEVDRVSIWFYEEEDQRHLLSCAGLYVFSTNSFSNHLEFISDYFPHYFHALTMHSHLTIPSHDDAELNQELASYLASFHIISKLDIPIIFEGKLLGVLCCEETREHRDWNLQDRHFGQTIADIIAIMIEQSARRKAEKALQESEERLRFLTQKSIDAIISITEKGEIVSWNYGAEQMFGFSEIEMLGKPLSLIFPHQDMHLVEIATKPVELKGKNKQELIFPVEISHTRWKSGLLYFDTIIVRDITERKEYETKLIKAIRDAKAANEAKSEFLTTISHELRTPLNAIIGFDQCLLMGMDGTINSQQTDSLKKIEKSSFHLLTLINDILDLAKIEASKMELEITPQNIVEIITSCVEEIQPLAKQKNLTINLSIDKPYILMEIDKLRIRQVLLNLLGNAVKFTEAGSINVHLINHSQEVEIRIEDTGIGLSADEMLKLFKPFSQADSSITRKYGGTGLGLAISKRIIDLHGGMINVQSEKGKGSIFSVILSKTQ